MPLLAGRWEIILPLQLSKSEFPYERNCKGVRIPRDLHEVDEFDQIGIENSLAMVIC